MVYGMPYDEWRAKYQKDASAGQKAAFESKPKALMRAAPPPSFPARGREGWGCAVLWMTAAVS